jgi:hypothetical protein
MEATVRVRRLKNILTKVDPASAEREAQPAAALTK